MAYKNSDGTSSIANQWGQWRYFNSALDKLGTAKPATITINENNVSIPEAENWMDCFTAVAQSALGVIEAKKESSYKLADEYLKTHSLEEYRDEMVKGLVPFQDDPLAMARLKESHGQLAFQYITEDFQRLVDQNKFKGLAPEQVDAEFFKYTRQQSADIAKTFGYSEKDVFFNRGLFTNSPKERLRMMVRQKEVENDFKVKEVFQADNAELLSIASSPDVNAGAIRAFLKKQKDTSLRFFTPDMQTTQFTTLVKVLSNNDSPNAYQTIVDLADDVMPGSGGIALKDVLTKDGYDTVKLNSLNKIHNSDAKARLDWENGIDKLVDQGASVAILAQRDLAFQESGGLLTDKVKYLEKAYDASLKVNERSRASAEKSLINSAEGNARLEIGKQYWRSVIENKDMKHLASYGISSNDANVAYDYLVATGALSEEDQVKIAMNDSVPFSNNPAKKFFTQKMDKAVGMFDGWVNAAVNKSYDEIPKKAEDIPEDLNNLLNLYDHNKVAFNSIFNKGSYNKNLIETLSMARESGKSLFDLVRGRANFEIQKREASEGKDLGKFEKTRQEVIKRIPATNIGGSTGLDSYGKTVMYQYMAQAVSLGMSPSEASEYAEKGYNNSYVNFMGTTIPRSFFTDSNGDFNDPAYSMFDDHIGKMALSKNQEGQFSKYYDVGYNRASDLILVYNKAGNCVYQFSKKDFEKYTNNFYEERKKNDIRYIEAMAIGRRGIEGALVDTPPDL